VRQRLTVPLAVVFNNADALIASMSAVAEPDDLCLGRPRRHLVHRKLR